MSIKTIISALLCLLLSLPLWAQAPADTSAAGGVVWAADTSLTIAEVRVTAREVRGAQTSTSLIGPTAMEHLQPASLADLMSLLPGGLTETPQMDKTNTIAIREVPYNDENYAVSALGTRICIDGSPLAADANMQQIPDALGTDADIYRTSINRGIDLRSIPTDEIETVEVIRGVPSVRYGDLTSGVVNIRRSLSESPLTVRFKVDPYSRLVSLAKGVDAPRGWTISAGAGFLASTIDPRSDYEKYKRLNLSLRARKTWRASGGAMVTWQPTLDFGINIDDDKSDPEQQTGKDDKYVNKFRSISFANDLSLSLSEWKFDGRVSLRTQHDETEQWMRFVNSQNLYAPSDTVDGMPHDVLPLEADYVAHHLVDGRPFYANVALSASRAMSLGPLSATLSAGGEWQCNKNFGRGQLFDPARPLRGSTTRRPRSFRSIPATNILGFFAEADLRVPISDFDARLTIGLRTTQMVGLDSDYAMHGKLYADPRANLSIASPVFGRHGSRVTLTLGAGRLAKMPTIDQLHPEPFYVELTELNYWNADPALRRRVTRAFRVDGDAPDLEPAHNVKLEARLAAKVDRHALSLTFFRENMDDGFRFMTRPLLFRYVRYDASAVDGSTLSAPPSLRDLPSRDASFVEVFRRAVNGTRIVKEGLEWQYDSPRLPVVHTRLSVCGAWLRTTRELSEPEWYQGAGVTVSGVVVDELYAGLYAWKQTTLCERTTTNFTAETYISSVGFIFSATAECVWKSERETPLRNATPIAYFGPDGEVRPYTEAEAADPILSKLIISNTATRFKTSERPYATFNFKATKEFGKILRMSFFADRLLAAAKDYELNGFTVRRTFKPYFGMQAYLKL